ncbi:MAG TPA: zinc ribbon domain-containing protein [Chloroflexota bacterium]|nr:zinc ribbon domain-containing protein [Chloroflexota bacterium]
MPSIICTRCGFANEGAVRFCGHCGASLVATPSGPVAPPSAEAPRAEAGAGIACPRCGTLNQAGVRFCGRCGMGFSAASPPEPRVAPVVFSPAAPAHVLAATPRKAGRGLPWAVVAAALGITMALLAAVSQAVMSHGAATCGVSCQPPPPPRPQPPLGPSGPPLPSSHRYTSATYGYSVDYPEGFDPSGSDGQAVGWSYTLNSDSSSFEIKIQGEAANGRTPQQLVQSVQQSFMSGASPVFTITGAELGSTAGYGQVYDFTTSPQGGQQQHLRLVVEAAIRDGVAVEMIAASLFIPDQNEHPSPAQMEPRVESLADQVGNTVVWRSEPAL